MSDLLLRATAKAGLSEDDPLYAVVAAQSEMIEGFLAEMNRKIAIHKASTPKLSGSEVANSSSLKKTNTKSEQLDLWSGVL
jgi:hypothetical protein